MHWCIWGPGPRYSIVSYPSGFAKAEKLLFTWVAAYAFTYGPSFQAFMQPPLLVAQYWATGPTANAACPLPIPKPIAKVKAPRIASIRAFMVAILSVQVWL